MLRVFDAQRDALPRHLRWRVYRLPFLHSFTDHTSTTSPIRGLFSPRFSVETSPLSQCSIPSGPSLAGKKSHRQVLHLSLLLVSESRPTALLLTSSHLPRLATPEPGTASFFTFLTYAATGIRNQPGCQRKCKMIIRKKRLNGAC